MRRAAIGTALAATLAACTCASPPAPTITSVAPARVARGVDTVLAIRGSNFVPVVRADLDDPAASQVNATFQLDIANGVARVALSAAKLVSDTELSAILPAGAAPLGTYDLLLSDPHGRSASLSAALDVVECVPDGGTCEDGDACTVGDLCVSGACVAGGTVACRPPPPCHVIGTCDPATGACSAPAAVPDRTSCNDGDPCTEKDSCQGGQCKGTLICSTESNTPPLACLEASPLAGMAGAAGGTTFTFDASCSTDAEDDRLGLPLTFRFAFDYGSGWSAWDTPASQVPTAQTTYSSPRVYTAAVEVVDSGLPQGPPLTSHAYRTVVVSPPAGQVLVTTALDEDDPGATPGAHGGKGLSLREAIRYVNGGSAPDRLISFDPATFAAGGTIVLRSRLPELTVRGTAIVGVPGLVIDCSSAALPAGWGCLRLGADEQKLVGLTVVGCADAAVAVASNLTAATIVDCTLVGPGAATASPTPCGVDAQSPIVVGPRNDVSGFSKGVNLKADGAVVDGNRIHANVVGVSAHGVGVTIRRNDVFGNAGAGLDVSGGTTMDTVWLNTIDGNSGDGVHANGTTLDLRDNLFTSNGGFGVNASGCSFASPGALGPNGYFANARGAVAGTATPMPGDVTSDPLYVSTFTADLRLRPASPAIDAGFDVGLDVNGPSPGRFDGLRPDLGAHEYPLPATPPR